ncbi:carbohydrate-binding protein [Saccharobesus litoralis]|uniref:Carbohydrate-binding protein n=1 Tax=Saccharobesus litoralis TaxID=2172099 RepID=A0A2S0VM23_9ALTE|nr:carbohydrate-binding protein [Saccharobesus litoralis]AWB65264.1 carbohydrate-binding protein [Saccharobesus litoralis]
MPISNDFRLTSLLIPFALAACTNGTNNHKEVVEPVVIPADAVNVRVDINTLQYFDDSLTLDRQKFFNQHDSQFNAWLYDVEDVDYMRNELNAGVGRQFWGPMSTAKALKQSYPSTETAKIEGKKSIESFNNHKLRSTYSNRSVMTEHPRTVVTDLNDNIVEGARWAADYFEYYYTDESRPLFFEPMNEPFVHAKDFVPGGWDAKKNFVMTQHMSDWFKEIGKEFDKRPALKDMYVMGFSSAWPSLELNDFNHFKERQKMFMDRAGDYIDSFSFHLYDGVNVTGQSNRRSGSNAQAIIDIIETYSMVKWDKVKPHALTEYGGIIDRPKLPNAKSKKDQEYFYDETIASQEIKSYNHMLMEFLDREERILTSIPFITGHATWYWPTHEGHPYSATLWRPDPAKIRLNTNTNRYEFINPKDKNNYLPTPKIKFYQLWNEVKGNRLATESSDPDIQTKAYVDGDTVYIALNNLEDESKTVNLAVGAGAGYQYKNLTLKRLAVPTDSPATLQVDSKKVSGYVSSSQLAANVIELAPYETVVYQYQFNKTVKADTQLRRETYYSDDFLQPIKANQPITIKFNQVDLTTSSQQHSTALLRMSIGRKHDKSKQPIVTINGSSVTVPNDWAGYDQANRKDFFGAIEIPVPMSLLKKNNQVRLTFPDTQGHVSSVVLEVNKAI